MTSYNYSGKTIHLDEEGFLSEQDEWNEEVAQALASHEGLKKLTSEQLEIIRFMRDYYRKFNAFPMLNYVCKNIKKPRECVNEQFINPEHAWKIAGLPKLDNIHFVSLDGKNFIMEECC